MIGRVASETLTDGEIPEPQPLQRRPLSELSYVASEPFGESLPAGYALEEESGRTRAVAHVRAVRWFGRWHRGQRGAAKAVGDAWVHATGARRGR